MIQSAFTSSTKVGPYLGLTPRQYQSGESEWIGGIGKTNDPLLRSYLYEAAGVLMTRVSAEGVGTVPASFSLSFQWIVGESTRLYWVLEDLPTIDANYHSLIIYSLITAAKLNDIDPQAWLADVLARVNDHNAKRLDELLPWNWMLRLQAAAA